MSAIPFILNHVRDLNMSTSAYVAWFLCPVEGDPQHQCLECANPKMSLEENDSYFMHYGYIRLTEWTFVEMKYNFFPTFTNSPLEKLGKINDSYRN
jgi:hypothetical protein